MVLPTEPNPVAFTRAGIYRCYRAKINFPYLPMKNLQSAVRNTVKRQSGLGSYYRKKRVRKMNLYVYDHLPFVSASSHDFRFEKSAGRACGARE